MFYIGQSKVRPGNLVSEAIDKASGGRGFCHTFLWIPKFETCPEAHANLNGVRMNYREPEADREILYPLADFTDAKGDAILTAAMRLDGRPYDYKGVFHFGCDWIKQDPNAFYCTEFVLTVLKAAGYFPGIVPSDHTPNSFDELLANMESPT